MEVGSQFYSAWSVHNRLVSSLLEEFRLVVTRFVEILMRFTNMRMNSNNKLFDEYTVI